MSDLDFQQLSTVQSKVQQKPNTYASAATIDPIHFLTFITGTVQLENITPPVTGAHLLVLVFTDASPGAFLTTGNIVTAIQPIQNEPVFLVWDPNSGNYYGGAVTG